MILEAYLAIQALAMASGSGIKHFDWYNQQYLDDNKEGYVTPAVFVEFLPVDPVSLPNKVQKADLKFRLHLVTDRTRHTSTGPKQRQALEHLTKAELLYKGFSGKAYIKDAETPDARQILNSCSRTNIMPDHNSNELIVTIQEFKTVCFDYSSVPGKLKAKPKQVIN